MKTIYSFCMIFLILICSNLAYADSIVYCDHTYTIFFSPITSKVYLACAGDFSTLDLITFDPITLTEEHNFYIGGTAESVIPTDGGVNLLLLLSNVDGDTSTNDGVLRKVNAATGTLIPGYEIEFDDLPLTMIDDSNQTFLYVSWGLSKKPATINKIRISDFQVMPESVDYGYKPNSIAITNDNSKLYVIDQLLHISGQPPTEQYYFNIGAFNTEDMSMICEISIGNIIPVSLQMCYDNRLFVSHPVPDHYIDSEISLIVINTETDEIIENISLGEQGILDIDIDPINQKLYGTIGPRDYYDPELKEYIWRSSEIIVQFDLTDPSYTPTYFNLGNEGLWDIAIASMPGFSRIFAIAEAVDSEFVYYMDL